MIPLEAAVAFVRGEPESDAWREAYDHPPPQQPLVDRVVTALRLQAGDKRAWLHSDDEAAVVLRAAFEAAEVDVDDVADLAQRDYIGEAAEFMRASREGPEQRTTD